MIILTLHTANHWPDSVCHISLAEITDQIITNTFDTYVYAETFDDFFTSIHGIDAQDVRHAPKLKEMIPLLENWLSFQDVISFHAPYEARLLAEMSESYVTSFPLKSHTSLLPILKALYPSIPSTLANYAQHLLGTVYPTEAENIAHLLLKEEVSSFKNTANMRRSPLTTLRSETVAFTGGLSGMTRSSAAKEIRRQGAIFTNTITQHTTILVVSAQSLERYEHTGHQSSKWQQALHLASKGAPIQIIDEQQFLQLLHG